MLKKIFVASILALISVTASALDYRVLNDNAIVYEGGFKQSAPQFILKKGTPVELIVTSAQWAKVREVGGGMGWVELTQLNSRNQVIVTAKTADVRQGPNETSALVFTAEKNVLLEYQGVPSGGWLKVKHQDGLTGYVQASLVWGFNN